MKPTDFSSVSAEQESHMLSRYPVSGFSPTVWPYIKRVAITFGMHPHIAPFHN